MGVLDRAGPPVLAEPTAPAVAAAVVEILRDPEAEDRLGRAALEHSTQASSWASVAQHAEHAYRDALAVGSP